MTGCSGSPPHTRGIRQFTDAAGVNWGFTPAYAGNTGRYPGSRICTGVHPRIRGEYPQVLNQSGLPGGSPPHTRGIQISDCVFQGSPRFTPAYAGNTYPQTMYTQHHEVHPRIRGEYFDLESPQIINSGSPPHTRGILSIRGNSKIIGRFTPAYAGNTSGAAAPRPEHGVHPRIRGEYYQPMSLR